jgi:hypothetical protein
MDMIDNVSQAGSGTQFSVVNWDRGLSHHTEVRENAFATTKEQLGRALASPSDEGQAKIRNLADAGEFEAACLCLTEDQIKIAKNYSNTLRLANQMHTEGTSSETVNNYIEVLDNRNREVEEEGAVNKRYLDYHNALNEFLVRIQAMIGTDPEGWKDMGSNELGLPVKKIIVAILQFIYAHRNDVIAGPLKSEAEAKELAKQFRQGTVTVETRGEGDNITFYLKPSFSTLEKLGPCLVGEELGLDLTALFKGFIRNPENPDDFWNWDAEGRAQVEEGTEPEDILYHFKLKKIIESQGKIAHKGTASAIQALQLTLDDIRKIHETETQFCVETYSRQLTQFNNLVKMFSAYMEALTQNLKGFL